MSNDVTVIFFDVGGVLLSNGWDRESRRAAADRFDLDWEDFQDRHDQVSAPFETGALDLATYLERTVFYRSRPFDRSDFADFMKAQTEPIPESLEVLSDLSASGNYLLATLNNESRELNEYRIDRFRLREHFSMFLSSCYLGVRKPEPEIYEMAIAITQQPAGQCLFVDDRELNLECAVTAGIRTIHFRDAEGLRTSLGDAGVEL
jgi:putative hydrolase of the HAD superfamily